MPPTEDISSECNDIAMGPLSSVQQLANAVTTMLRNGIINNANRVVLDPIDPYSGAPVPYLPNLRDLLRRTSGTDDLASITELKLKVITRDAGLQHLSVHTPNLRELTLDGSVVSSLRDLGCRLHSLKVLKVNRCKLRCLDGLNGLRSIEKLYAANNKLTDLTACTSMEFVRHIDVAGNLIDDLNVVGFLVLCGTLKHLVLEENFGLSNRPCYREEVRRLIPQLVSLDGVEYPDPPGRPHYSLPGRGEDDHNADKQPIIETSHGPLTTSSSPSTSTGASTSSVSAALASASSDGASNGCYAVSFAPKVLSPRNENNVSSTEDCPVTTRLLPKI